MNRLLLMISLIGLSLTGFSQGQIAKPVKAVADSSRIANEQHWFAWQKDLYEMGVSVQHDSLRISPAVKRLFTDSLARRAAYPASYTWPVALELMKQMELKQAFWHLINLYPTDSTSRTMVLQTVVTYDKIIDMNKALISSFYTYAFADPRVGELKNGRPNIRRPDLMDQKLSTVRAIVDYVTAYRKTKSSSPTNRHK
ncbi:MAG: hypothetical protein JWP57_4222 [Spirosoma sp.]|nr:hypothetical protein [Spirosoma sp.]